MKKLNLIHLGIGNVGSQLMKEIINGSSRLEKEVGVSLKYYGFANSQESYFYPAGYASETELYKNKKYFKPVEEMFDLIPHPFALVDTTASEATYALWKLALEKGGCVASSNKKPLTRCQKDFDILMKYSLENLGIETTVGAALPVIITLKNLIESGDEIIEILGCFSGTLGFICSAMENGMSYSDSVHKARELGYTEPDPRDDLSGLDVARKALIISRLMGKKLELEDIKRNEFFDKKLNAVGVEEFMTRCKSTDKKYSELMNAAKVNKNTLRYVAKIDKKQTTVGLTQVQLSSPIGRLNGPENIVVFRTRRYDTFPLVIQGPGAGVEVTASGVLNDLINLSRQRKIFTNSAGGAIGRAPTARNEESTGGKENRDGI